MFLYLYSISKVLHVVFRLFQDISNLNADQIAAKEAEELQKGRRELQAKLKSQEKKVDYYERAKRLEEIPLLQASMKERQLQDQAFWEQQEKERITFAIEERRLAVATRDRLSRMKPDKDAFLEKLLKERNVVYEDKLKEFEKLVAAERQKRLLERKVQRKEERRQKYLKEKEIEEERKRDEERQREMEEKAKQEEAERREREERERVEREEREKVQREQQEMLDRAAAKKKQREEEVERKLMEDKSKEPPSSWRRRIDENAEEPKKMDTWKPSKLISWVGFVSVK